MFYRRKILLALLEIFGGSLAKADCPKLLFLFCLRRGKNYYDFFPHKYGNFSFILSQDRNRLVDLGFLVSCSDYQLVQQKLPYLDQLEKKDYVALQDLAREVGNLRGEKLVRKVYLEAPHYTSRSQIADKVLNREEYELISRTWHFDQSACLFTIGYEGLSIDAYLDLLVSNNVVALIDVRKNPISMKYGFSKTRLAEYASVAGVLYIPLPNLGIPSNMRKDLDSSGDYEKLFDFYFSHILPEQEEALGRLKSAINDYKRVAITCFEADHRFCHRHKIAEYLKSGPDFKTPIYHLSKECLCSSNSVDKPLLYGLWDENKLYSLR